MKGLVFKDVGLVAVEEVEDPRIEDPRDAIVRVTTAPICGSDLHLYHGRAPGMSEGSVMGHELVGIVEEVGEQISNVSPGDRVVGSFMIPCGHCWWCDRSEYNNCDNGNYRALGYGIFAGDLNGAQAEKVRVPNADLTLMSIPNELNDEQAVFAGDILTTGFYGVKLADIRQGDAVAVMGCGPVGLFAIQYARMQDPGQLFALDRVPDRLAMAQALGATPVDVSKRNAVMALAEATEGRGADTVIECVGQVDAFRSGYEMLRSGGHMVVVGLYMELEYPFPIGEAWRKNIRLTFAGVTPVPALWREALDAVIEGRVDPTVIISDRMPLSEGPEAYRRFDRREATKILLNPQD